MFCEDSTGSFQMLRAFHEFCATCIGGKHGEILPIAWLKHTGKMAAEFQDSMLLWKKI